MSTEQQQTKKAKAQAPPQPPPVEPVQQAQPSPVPSSLNLTVWEALAVITVAALNYKFQSVAIGIASNFELATDAAKSEFKRMYPQADRVEFLGVRALHPITFVGLAQPTTKETK